VTVLFSKIKVMNERPNNTVDSYSFNNGTIIIVDISGFTKLVYSTDLASGKNITLSLLSSIIRNNRLGLSIAEIEGDAIFFYKFGKSPSHEAVLQQYQVMLDDFIKTLDQLYSRGAERIDLTLKMVVHNGAIAQYQIRHFKKLYGEPVMEAHLLLKNEINSHSYVLMTDDYINSLHNQNIEGYSSKGSKICEVLGGMKNVCYTCYDYSKVAA
jgi:Protein of unknown function (DUF2652)